MSKSAYTGNIRIDCPTTAVNNVFTAKAYHDTSVVAEGTGATCEAAKAACIEALKTTSEGDLSNNPRTGD